MRDYTPIKGYERYYGINERGEVFSTYYGIILKHGLSAGYPRVTLYKPGNKPKGVHIHRLLAEHFIPNPKQLPQVNHIDGNPLNFALSNLEWVTEQYNVQDGYNRGRKPWNAGLSLVDRNRTCEHCGNTFRYKKLAQRFCNNTCASYASIELIKAKVITI